MPRGVYGYEVMAYCVPVRRYVQVSSWYLEIHLRIDGRDDIIEANMVRYIIRSATSLLNALMVLLDTWEASWCLWLWSYGLLWTCQGYVQVSSWYLEIQFGIDGRADITEANVIRSIICSAISLRNALMAIPYTWDASWCLWLRGYGLLYTCQGYVQVSS